MSLGCYVVFQSFNHLPTILNMRYTFVQIFRVNPHNHLRSFHPLQLWGHMYLNIFLYPTMTKRSKKNDPKDPKRTREPKRTTWPNSLRLIFHHLFILHYMLAAYSVLSLVLSCEVVHVKSMMRASRVSFSSMLLTYLCSSALIDNIDYLSLNSKQENDENLACFFDNTLPSCLCLLKSSDNGKPKRKKLCR